MTALTPDPPGGVTLAELSRRDGRTATDAVMHRSLGAAAGLSILISLLIIGVLLGDALSFASKTTLRELGANSWSPARGNYGVMSPLLGTLWVTLVATAIAGPIGLGAAIYLSEYASGRVRKVVKPVIEVLASIPSVVVGYFAFRFIAPEITQRIFSGSPTANLLVAGLGVGLLTIPLMTSVSEDALRAVPSSLREASYGIGAKKITTVVRIVVPAAVSGLVAGVILTISRAIGETMVVLLAGGLRPSVPGSPLDSGLTITSAMTSVVGGGSDSVQGGKGYESIFFLGLLLFLITLALNLFANRFVRRVRQTY